MQDITHLKELDRMKTEFVSTVSHDLRSPLTSIMGYAQILKSFGPLNEKQEMFVERIMRGVNQIIDLIGDLLDISRIEAGVGMDMVPCNVPKLAEKVIDQLKDAAAAKNQQLIYQGMAQQVSVLGNELRLRQVINNLVGNAIKYTQEGGEIRLTVRLEDQTLLLSLEDNGIGISPSDLPFIFDKFYRVESDATADIQGTGLGLSICKSVVEKHDGRIWADSMLGEGSIFYVALPVLTQTDPPD
jgi:two-component system NtrC family sensor kinase